MVKNCPYRMMVEYEFMLKIFIEQNSSPEVRRCGWATNIPNTYYGACSLAHLLIPYVNLKGSVPVRMGLGNQTEKRKRREVRNPT